MGQRHAEVVRATPGARLVAVYDRDLRKAQLTANGACDVAASYDALLKRNDLDAVVLCIPSAFHAEYGISAAQAGKHVITEKPIDSSPAAAQKLIDTCQNAGLKCAVISQYRFSDGNMAVKQALSNGQLSSPRLAHATIKWFRHDAYYAESDWRGRVAGEGGGVLINQAVHAIDLLCWFLGPPVEVQGFTAANRNVMETEDTAVAILRFRDNCVATIDASTSAHPGFSERVELFGEDASVILEKNEITEWHSATNEPMPAAPVQKTTSPGLSPKLALFQRQYFNILQALRGEAQLLVRPEEAITAVKVIRTIYGQQL